MKLFNGRTATEDYMSAHSLTFSTPEMTLKKFALWLGEQVNSPEVKGQQVPRLLIYLEDKDTERNTNDMLPDVNERFEPSGAVTDMFRGISGVTDSTEQTAAEKKLPEENKISELIYCFECGSKIRASSRFCAKCGTKRK